MNWKSGLLAILILLLVACSSSTSKNESMEEPHVNVSNVDSIHADSMFLITKQNINFEAVLDTVLPFFAKLHDSIPSAKKFDPVYKEALKVHVKERQVKGLYFTRLENGTEVYMISRLEPSMNKDKFSALCFTVKRNASGALDLNSYKEEFWTWKLKQPELMRKSAKLYREFVEGKDLSSYYPQNSKGYFIMFPDERVSYDVKTKKWASKDEMANIR
jgi:hypothetical protein